MVIIDAPLPKVASTADEVKKANEDKNKLEIVVYIDGKGLRLKSDFGGSRDFPKVNDKYPLDEFHKHLVSIHQRKKDSREITLIPSDDVTYDTMISVMDSAREYTKDDPGYQALPPDIAQKPESLQFNRLFPDVSIGGV